MIVDEHTLDDLFQPLPFKREHYSAHLYSPYSIKLHRRVHLYGHETYDVWAMIESDPSITIYNESVIKLPLVFEGVKATNKAPNFISSNENKSITLHTVAKVDTAEEDQNCLNSAWTSYCDQHGFNHQVWTSEKLNSIKVKIANYRKLLRYTSMAGAEGNHALEQQILSLIKNFRKIIFSKIIHEFPSLDPEDVKASLVRLIIDNKIYSDLEIYPLSMLTEISAYHEINP